jgi:transcriptional regulator GlxA family with amidase domain
VTTMHLDEQWRQERLQKKLNHARKMTENKVAEVKRVATSIGFWQRKCTYYEREMGKTLAQKRLQAEARKIRRRVRKVVL